MVTTQVTTTMNKTMGSRAMEILQDKIHKGRETAAALIEKIEYESPEDALVRGAKLSFGTKQLDDRYVVEAHFGKKNGHGKTLHRNAIAQLAERGGIHAGYLRGLIEDKLLWKQQLAAEILNEHYHHDLAAEKRYLARSVHGQLRGWLSDKYRRLDSRPLVDTFARECQSVGAIPYEGSWSDTRVSLKAVLDQVFEPVPGEAIALGIEWSNSDFGRGIHALRAFILRVWCLNGATMENALGQVHLGRQLTDDIELSQRTYELDTKASISALSDVVRGVLAPPKVDRILDNIRRAEEQEINWKQASAGWSKKLLKSEMELAKEKWEDDGVTDLPPRKTKWKKSNVLSWLANRADDEDRKMELQRMAGEALTGVRD